MAMMSSSSGKKTQRRPVRVSVVRDVQFTRSPDPIPTQFRFGVHLRYIKTNASVATVAWKDIFNTYVMATSSTVGYSIIDAVKLRKLIAYAPPLIQTSSTGINNAPLKIILNGNVAGTSFGSDRTAQDYPTAQGAVVMIKPSPPVDDWMADATSSSTCFSVYGTVGVIVDIKVTYQLRCGIAGGQVALASTGATTGVVYGNYLDSSGTQFLQALGPVNNTLVWA